MAEVLIAGSTGGREHALGLAMAEEGHTVSFTHGNAGTEQIGESLGLTSLEQIVDYAVQQEVDLVVVGPEAPLVEGLTNKLLNFNVPTFGPEADGAKLEASKRLAAEFMDEFGIPTPDSYATDSPLFASRYIGRRSPEEYVIKADGLAGGKGVLLPDDHKQALQYIDDMMSGDMFGDAGKAVVFQRRLDPSAPEFSAYMVSDGKDFVLLPVAQDHKRLGDGDSGPNTGGMGAYTPVPFANRELIDDISEIAERTMHGLQHRGIDYRGVLFLGGMIDSETMKPSILEYNVRFGDPETEVLMTTLKAAGVKVYDLLNSAANGRLETGLPSLTGNLGQAALTVCLAAEGYPNSPRKGDVIHGLDQDYEGVTVHHGGTQRKDGQVVVSGGRVLYATATGEDTDQAAARAYGAIGPNGVHFDGMQYRTDIAHQARTS